LTEAAPRAAIRVAVALLALSLAAVALNALVPAFGALVGPPETGGIDLQSRAAEVSRLWSGQSPYGLGNASSSAVYPPASYVMLTPLAWLPYEILKWLWAGSAVGCLLWLGWLAGRVAGARGPEQVALAGFVPASIAGVAYGVQNGQLHVHVVAALVGAALLLLRSRPSLRSDLLGGVLLLFALVKPTVAGPFCLLLLARRDRVPVLVGLTAAYCVLTAVGGLVTGEGLQILTDWLHRARGGASFGAGGSYGNVHAWSAMLGLSRFDPVATVIVVAGVVGFAFSGRAARAVDGERWGALAVVALGARVAVYHQDYDDTLLIGVQLALLARWGRGRSLTVVWVLGALVLVQLGPREWLNLGGAAPSLLEWARLGVWAVALAMCVQAGGSSGYPEASGGVDEV